MDFQSLIQRFDNSYANMNFNIAADAADEVLDRFPMQAYRYFVTHQSYPWVQALAVTGRLDMTAAKLDRLLTAYPALNVLCNDEPGAAERAIESRQELIAQGLPSVLFVPLWKSGSVTLGSIFTRGFGLAGVAYALINRQVIPSWARDYARGGACYVTHLNPDPSNIRRLKDAGIRKIIVHVRDPRQVLLSSIHHVDRYSEDFPEYANDEYQKKTLEEKIDFAISNGGYYETVKWIDGWLKASEEVEVLFSTFEEFKRSPEELIERYLDFYGSDRSCFRRDSVFRREENVDDHFRLGDADEWRRMLSTSQVDVLNSVLTEQMRSRFAWS